jgi:hypothetical protein
MESDLPGRVDRDTIATVRELDRPLGMRVGAVRTPEERIESVRIDGLVQRG